MRSWTIAFLPVFVLAVGCGTNSDQPKSASVKGKVTLDGNPMPSGKIVFDEGPSKPAGEFEIKDGVYSGTTFVGKKTVRITAIKYGPAPKGMEKMPGYEKGVEQTIPIPAKYNTDSKDTKEVKEGTNEFDFAVTSK